MSQTTDPHRVRFRPGITDIAIVGVLLSPALTTFDDFANDPGLGWHIATGAWITENGAIPKVDPFLARSPALEWVSDQWASDVLLHLALQNGGWVALYGLLTAAFFLAFLGIARHAAATASGTWLGGLLAGMCALKLGTIHFIARPVIFAFVFFAAVFALCTHITARQHADASFGRSGLLRAAWPLPLVFALWANFHPSFVLGLLVVAIAVIAFLLEPVAFAESRPSEKAWQGAAGRMAAVGVACFVATLVNPYGYGLHESIFALAGSEYFARLNLEWHSPDFLEDANQIALMLFLFVLGVRVVARETARWTLFEVGTVMAFTVGYLRSVRLLPFLAIVFAVPLARSFAALGTLDLLGEMELLQKAKARLAALERWERGSSCGLVGVLVGLALVAAGVATGNLPRGEATGPSADEFPLEAIAHLASRDVPAVVYANPNVGGIITFFGEGRVKAWIDDRNTMLGEAPYKEVFDVLAMSSPDWREKLYGSGATHALIQRRSALDFALRAEGVEPVVDHERYVLYALVAPRER